MFTFSDTLWPVYFWVTALLVYIILLALLVCIWKCSPKKKRKQSVYVITVEDKEELDDYSNSIELKEMPIKDGDVVTDINANDCDEVKDTPVQDELFPRCSLRQKKRPQTLTLTEERPVSQNLSSPLTPRELFFIDLIEGANRTCSSTTHTFLENEKLHYSPDCPPSIPLVEDKLEPSSPSEFFIANVPGESKCTSEVFLYVDSNNVKEQVEIICEIKKDNFID